MKYYIKVEVHMTVKKGLGFMAWQLRSLPTPEEVLEFMNYYGANWISLKMIDSAGVDGPFPYNWRNGDVAAVTHFIKTLTDGGKKVGFWIYTSGYKPGPDGSMISEVIEKFEKYGLCFVDLDAESGVWNQYGSKSKMETLLDSTFVPKRIPIYLDSYRFPTNFPQFPFKPALRHDKVNGFNSPQVYWEFSHNPTAQLNRCYVEYKALDNTPFNDFVPIAPAYWRGKPGVEGSWGPTVADLKAFKVRVNELSLPGYGVYSLDKVWQHYNATTYTSGADWMEALTGKPKMSETPPPPPPAGTSPRAAEVVINRLNQRTAPIVSSATYAGYLSKGQKPFVHGTLFKEADGRIWAKIGADKMYVCFVDYNGTPLMKWVDVVE
jgi:hypothetical protein